jgi:hypothetical protein
MSKNPAGINPAAARGANRTRAQNHAGNPLVVLPIQLLRFRFPAFRFSI